MRRMMSRAAAPPVPSNVIEVGGGDSMAWPTFFQDRESWEGPSANQAAMATAITTAAPVIYLPQRAVNDG